MIYNIEHKIESLLDNTVMNPNKPASFDFNYISFSHWDFSWRDGWTRHSWLATGHIYSDNFNDALNNFRHNLARITPRIAFIGQAYIEFVQQPFLISKQDSPIAFLSFFKERGAVPLCFTAQSLKALQSLLRKKRRIPDEFFYYWNDTVNTTGYSSKLLLMFSAIESFAKIKKDKKDMLNYKKLERIFGKRLKRELWGEKGKSKKALRNRLTHGEYFQAPDSGIDYVKRIHKKLICYFNKQIFKEPLLSDDVVNPQRHFWGNKEGGNWLIRAKGQNNLNLKTVLSDFNENDINNLKNYEIVSKDDLGSTF